MRIRSVKPEFFRDPDTTGRWPADLKVFYLGLWCVSDDEGRFMWDPDLIAADLFPFDRGVDVPGLLRRLSATGRVLRYEVAGRAYGFLPKFAKHQKINRPTPSRLPPPPEGLAESSMSAHGGLTAGSGAWSMEHGAGNGGSAESSADAAASAPPSVASAAVVLLPCVGKGPSEFAVTQAQVTEWQTAYPGVDVAAEMRKARAWLGANLMKRKTHRGAPAFCVGWLNRAQNEASQRRSVGPALAPSQSFDDEGKGFGWSGAAGGGKA